MVTDSLSSLVAKKVQEMTVSLRPDKPEGIKVTSGWWRRFIGRHPELRLDRFGFSNVSFNFDIVGYLEATLCSPVHCATQRKPVRSFYLK